MVQRFRVKSSLAAAKGISLDDPAAWHIVRLIIVNDRPVFMCDCPGNATWNRECHHIRRVKALLANDTDGVTDDTVQELSDNKSDFDVDSLLNLLGGV